MNAYEYAMEMEKEGELFYRELAEKATDEGLKQIFTNLADEEVKHFVMFQKLAASDGDVSIPKMNVAKDAKAIFSQMKASGKTFSFGDDQVAYYKKAMETEDKAYELYVQKAKEMTDPKHQEIFLKIAQEELKHKVLLENLVEFVSSPNEWLENAEFHKIDEE